jgi:hypothetical protein
MYMMEHIQEGFISLKITHDVDAGLYLETSAYVINFHSIGVQELSLGAKTMCSLYLCRCSHTSTATNDNMAAMLQQYVEGKVIDIMPPETWVVRMWGFNVRGFLMLHVSYICVRARFTIKEPREVGNINFSYERRTSSFTGF